MKKFLQCLFIVFITLFIELTNPFELEAVQKSRSNKQTARKIILVVTDGMCANAIRFARDVLVGKDKDLEIDKFPIVGRMIGYPQNGNILDSAAAATAFATGKPAALYTIGTDEDGTPRKSLFITAKELGFKIGLVSDTRITHATPAPFAVNTINRDDEIVIAEQIVNSSFDVLLSGGRQFFLPKESGGKLPDGKNLLQQALRNGFTVVLTREELKQSLNKNVSRVLGLFANSFMPLEWEEGYKSLPTLPEMTEAAVSILEKGQHGFFLMVEAGKMDFANHKHDPVGLLFSMKTLEMTLKFLLEYARKDPSVLIVVVTDHATGGFRVSEHFDPEIFKKYATSTIYLAERFKNRQSEIISELYKLFPNINITPSEREYLINSADFDTFQTHLGSIISRYFGLLYFPTEWQKTMTLTKGHTGEDLFIHAIGKGQELFSGRMRIWEIPHRLAKAAGFSFP